MQIEHNWSRVSLYYHKFLYCSTLYTHEINEYLFQDNTLPSYKAHSYHNFCFEYFQELMILCLKVEVNDLKSNFIAHQETFTLMKVWICQANFINKRLRDLNLWCYICEIQILKYFVYMIFF